MIASRFNVLGPLEVWHGDALVPIPAGRARLLLATLLLRANQPVPADELVDRLWDGVAPNPDRAKATLQMVVRRLRQALGEASGRQAGRRRGDLDGREPGRLHPSQGPVRVRRQRVPDRPELEGDGRAGVGCQ